MVVLAKVFMSGGSQAVRIPKSLRLDSDEVEVRKERGGLLLKPIKKDPWANLKEVAGTFPADFFPEEQMGNGWAEDYPRMGFSESTEHFEQRVKAYEQKRNAYEQRQRGEHGQK